MRGGCQSSNVIFLYDAYYQLNLHERRAQPNSLAASLLLFRATGMAFNADGAAILSTFCGATGRLYQPVLLTECLAATCASRTSWLILSWVNANSFALSPVSCSIGDIPTNINYAQPFQSTCSRNLPPLGTRVSERERERERELPHSYPPQQPYAQRPCSPARSPRSRSPTRAPPLYSPVSCCSLPRSWLSSKR